MKTLPALLCAAALFLSCPAAAIIGRGQPPHLLPVGGIKSEPPVASPRGIGSTAAPTPVNNGGCLHLPGSAAMLAARIDGP
jgi:hypothetical protein